MRPRWLQRWQTSHWTGERPCPNWRERPGVLSREFTNLRQELATELTNLEQLAATPASEDAQNKPNVLAAKIQQLRDDLDYLKHSRVTRFFIDLLGENGTVTLHRLQIVVWTLVLGFVFISRVLRDLSMPVFSDALLGLMGLSSATYVALKVPELKKTQGRIDSIAKAS